MTFHIFVKQNLDSPGSDNYNGRTVVVYFGEYYLLNIYQCLAHGNRKWNERGHKSTRPSVLSEIKKNRVYKKIQNTLKIKLIQGNLWILEEMV